jgi:serine/threonine-protein kinase SRK2
LNHLVTCTIRCPHPSPILNVCRWYFQQLIVALDFCHKKNIGHRDLKLENLLLAPITPESAFHHLKLADFGFTANQTGTVAQSVVGTYCYMAPDVFTANATNPYSPAKADVWSCGVILYTMLTGTNAFPIQAFPPRTRQSVIWQYITQHYLPTLLRGCPPIPQTTILSPECHALLHQLLNPNPAERISVEGIIANPWFRQDLEPGVLEMNEQYLQLEPPVAHQTDEQITAVVQQALAGAAGGVGVN